MFRFSVVGNRVAIVQDERQTATAAGLILPPGAQEDSQTGVVVGVGDGGYHEKTGKWMPIVSVDEGDRVLFSKYGGTEIEVEGVTVLLVSPTDIFCIVDDE